MDQYHPGVVVVEQWFAHYDHLCTAILMAHARGVILLAAGQRDMPVQSYNATCIKKIVTGNGHASKDQMQRTIQANWACRRPPEPPDVADAGGALGHYYLLKRPA